MKSILILFVFFINSSFVYSQEIEMSVETLEHLVAMNSSQYEDWALRNNYEFDKIDRKYEFFDIIYYLKKGKNCIGFAITKNGKAFGSIQFQTRNSSVYIKLKSDCVKKGYKFKDTDPYNLPHQNGVFQKYKKDKYELDFNPSNKDEHYGFSIGISID